MENNTTKNKTEYVDSEYGFKYTKNEDGTIIIPDVLKKYM